MEKNAIKILKAIQKNRIWLVFGIVFSFSAAIGALLTVTYYGRTPSVSEAFHLFNQQTPYNFSFWVLEIILGVFLPADLLFTSRFNRNPAYLFLGAIFAVHSILVNRWNVTVGDLFVPLSYSPGTLYQLPPRKYFPGLPEWGIAIGTSGYALSLLTLGIRYLPLLEKGNILDQAASG